MKLGKKTSAIIALALTGLLLPSTVLAQAKKPAKTTPSATTSQPIKVEKGAPDDDVVTASSTRIDFSETSIDGKMKAPEGFFLQGHTSGSLAQMVKLRSNFRNELRNSSSAVKSHVK